MVARTCLILGLVGCGGRLHGERFSGTVTAVDDGCAVDATCSMTISGSRVIFGQGWSRSTWGEVTGLDWSRPDALVGREAEVFARSIGDGFYTLEGDGAYFIHADPAPPLPPRCDPHYVDFALGRTDVCFKLPADPAVVDACDAELAAAGYERDHAAEADRSALCFRRVVGGLPPGSESH